MFSIHLKMTSTIQSFISFGVKTVVSAVGSVFAILEPTFPFVLICTLAVLADCYTAWALSRRVKKKFPGANDGKFKSHYAGRVFITLIKVYSIIILAFLADNYICITPMYLPNIIAGAIFFWQLWSMLENESSCNNARWARILQRIMVDKTERHFDLDLHELKHTDKATCGNTSCAYNGTETCNVGNMPTCPFYCPPKRNEEQAI